MCPTACSPCFTSCTKRYLDKTITWAHDVGGNITSRKEYALTTNSILFNPTKADSYTYGSDWKDQLTSFSGKSCIYDLAGNPTTYKGDTLTWEGMIKIVYELLKDKLNIAKLTFTSGVNAASAEFETRNHIERCPLCGIALNEKGVCPKCGYRKQ